MAIIDLSNLSVLNKGRAEKILSQKYNRNGVIATMREFIEKGKGVKRKFDCCCGIDRDKWHRKFNEAERRDSNLFKKASKEYSYLIDNMDVPKLVFDSIPGEVEVFRGFVNSYFFQLNDIINRKKDKGGFDKEVLNLIETARIPMQFKVGDIFNENEKKYSIVEIYDDRRGAIVKEVGGESKIKLSPFSSFFNKDF